MLSGCNGGGDAPDPTAICTPAPGPSPTPPPPTPEGEDACKVIDGPEVVALGWGENDWGTPEENIYPGFAYEVRWEVENPEDCVVVQFVAIAFGVDNEVIKRWGALEYPRLDNETTPLEARYASRDNEWVVKKDDNSIVMYDRPGPGGLIDRGETFSLWFNAWPRLYSRKIYDKHFDLNTAQWSNTYGGEWNLEFPPCVSGSSLPPERPYYIHWENYDKNMPSVFPETDQGMGTLSLP